MADLIWVISSSVLIIAVLIIRAVFGKRMRSGLRCALWGLVLIRLLIPGTIFELPFSVESTATKIDAVSNIVEFENVSHYGYDEENKMVYYYRPDFPAPKLVVTEENVPYERFVEIEKTIDVIRVLRIVWYSGIAATAAAFLVKNGVFYLNLRRRRKRIDVKSKLKFYRIEGISSPFLFGNSIYVDTAVSNDEEKLNHVLSHELSHYRHKDHWFAVLRCALLCLHWYNPLVWAASYFYRRDADLFADDGAIRALGDSERENYGRTLIAFADASKRESALSGAIMMIGGKSALFERIKRIAKKPKTSIICAISALVVALSVVVVVFAGKSDEKPRETPDEIGAGTSIEDNSDIDNDNIINIGIKDDGHLDLPDRNLIESIKILRTSGCFGYNDKVTGGNAVSDRIIDALENVTVDVSSVENPQKPEIGGDNLSFVFSLSDGTSYRLLFYFKNYPVPSDEDGVYSECYKTYGYDQILSIVSELKGINIRGKDENAMRLSDYFSISQIAPESFNYFDELVRYTMTLGTTSTSFTLDAKFNKYVTDDNAILLSNGKYLCAFRDINKMCFAVCNKVSDDHYEIFGLMSSKAIYDQKIVESLKPGMTFSEILSYYYRFDFSPSLYSEDLSNSALILTYDGTYRLIFNTARGTDPHSLDGFDELIKVEKYDNYYINEILSINYNNSLGVLSDELLSQIISDYIEYLQVSAPYDPEIDGRPWVERYYGSYDGAVPVIISGFGITGVERTEEIAGYNIYYQVGHKILVWHDGDFFTMQEAYDKEFLTESDVCNIAYFHKNEQYVSIESPYGEIFMY